MKSLSTSILAIISIIPLIFSTGCRHSFMNHFKADSPEKMADKFTEHITDELKLDNLQKEKLNKIKNEIVQKLKERRKEVEPAFDGIHKELSGESIDRNSLISQLDKMSERHKEMHPFIADKIIEFQSILTKEQKEILSTKVQEYKEKHKRME